MKKSLVVLVALLMVGFTKVNAQVDLTFSKGIKVNTTMSNFRLNGVDGKSKMGFGVSVGNSDKLEIGENFALQGEFIIHYKTSKMTDKTTQLESDLKYWGVEVPAYGIGQMKMGSGKAFIGIGPYLGYGFSAKSNPGKINLYKKDKTTGETPMKRWDFGGGVILGYEFENGLFVNASYKMGFLDSWNVYNSDAKVRSQTLSFGLGYRFSLFAATFDKNKFKFSGK
ncbi:hypothetical protein Barb7_00492 [Bacteroidales bacterium Barb7]|nr:hypothetical protein Barb7_00492 [Bacteroidales bacterium Barb7]